MVGGGGGDTVCIHNYFPLAQKTVFCVFMLFFRKNIYSPGEVRENGKVHECRFERGAMTGQE